MKEPVYYFFYKCVKMYRNKSSHAGFNYKTTTSITVYKDYLNLYLFINIANARLLHLGEQLLELIVEQLAPDGHLQRVEGVLEDIIGVQLVHLAQQNVDTIQARLRDHNELDAGERLKAVQREGVRLQQLNARAFGLRTQLAGNGEQGIEHAGQEDLLIGGHLWTAKLEVNGIVLRRLQRRPHITSIVQGHARDGYAVDRHQDVANCKIGCGIVRKQHEAWDTPTIYSILAVERHRNLLGIVVQHQVQRVCEGFFVLDARHIVVQVEYKATRFANYIDAIYNHC